MKTPFKILAIFQTLIQLWVTVCLLYWSAARPLPAYADRFSDTASQGQALGSALVPDPGALATQGEDGSINLHWQGQTSTFQPEDLFPDSQNTTDPEAAAAFGSEAQVMNRANAENQAMGNSNSFTGEAYRTLTGSLNRARVNLSNDPLWQQTDSAIDMAQSGVQSNCEIVTLATPVTTTAHVPDLETCERVYYPGGACHCYHDYSVEFLGQYSIGAWGMSSNSISLTVNVQSGAVSCGGCQGGAGVENWSPPPSGACSSPGEGVRRAISVFMPYAGAAMAQEATCDNGLTATFTVQNTGHNPEYLHSGTLLVYMYHIIDHGWTCDPGCEVLLTTNGAGDTFIRPESYTCTLGPCESATSIGGAYVSQGHLYSTNPFASWGISNLAHEVTINLEDFNQGVMRCWTDAEGEVHCPQNLGERHDTCAELENNPNCSFVRQECIEDAEDPESGICYAWTVVYDCGLEVEIEDVTTTMGYVCDGVIRCMGEECVDGRFDANNTGFAQAAALLQVTQYGAADMDCTGGDCKIWSGDLYRCKKALGGWVDCCTKPEGVSLVDYIKLLGDSFSIASMQWDLSGVLPSMLAQNPLTGAWTALGVEPPSGVWNLMERTFSSAWDSLVGSTSSVIEEAAQAGMTGAATQSLTQSLMHAANNLLTKISPDLAAAVFETTGTYIAFTSTIQTLISAVTFISWIYTIYNILDILVHIIWACEESEFELGAKRQLKVCHYVGSYCASDILGICIEKKETYCCYNSPLARIMQEQIRAQGVGGGWGSAKNPRCDGLYTSQLAQVNWNAVDLSEWLALLSIGGQYPTQKDVSIDGLTGSGSQFNFGSTSSTRPDAATRTQSRASDSGVDLEQLRIEGSLQLWGQGN